MTKDFSQAMAERSGRQLADIVTFHRDDYEPEALRAAEQEIVRRQIDINDFYTEEQVVEARFAAGEDKANLAFRWQHKAGTVLLPCIVIVLVTALFKAIGQAPFIKVLGFPVIVLVHYLIYRRLRDTGYTRMAKDFAGWIAYTLFIYIGLLLLLGLVVYFFLM